MFEPDATTVEKTNLNSNRGGRRPGAGRKPGVANKITGDLKAMILDALGRAGGVEYLCGVARNDPKAFCSLLGRVLPMTVVGDATRPVTIQIVSCVPRPEDVEPEIAAERNAAHG